MSWDLWDLRVLHATEIAREPPCRCRRPLPLPPLTTAAAAAFRRVSGRCKLMALQVLVSEA